MHVAPPPAHRIRDSLKNRERTLRPKKSAPPYDRDIAREARIPVGTYSEFKRSDAKGPREPSLSQLLQLARVFRVPPEALFDAVPPELLYERDGVSWKLSGETAGPREEALRLAAVALLEGDSPNQANARLGLLHGAQGQGARPLDTEELRWMARGGLALGLVELLPSRSGEEARDLGERLSEALARVAPGEIRPRARVVPNLAHPAFGHDPIAPFLIARTAHRVVADFLRAHPRVYTLGIAGGLLVSAFVRSIGAASSPLPDEPGSDKRFDVVPLTLEPMYDHHYWLADALVGELVARASYLLGPSRVMAPSFKPFSYLLDREVEHLPTDSVVRVRKHYGDLGVGVYGCGDKQDDGWIRAALQDQGVELEPTPHTDVCLNMLSEEGAPIPLPDVKQQRREYLGVSLRDVGRLAASPDKLGLLLTSGASKGSPLVAVVKAGCANAIVCDERAARAALERLDGSPPKGRPAKSGGRTRPPAEPL